MTRINLVNVKDLADQHLHAEWREIKMIPPALRRSIIARQKTYNISILPNSNHSVAHTVLLRSIPATYTLNTGHVTFFYDKLTWLKFRYEELTQELLSRGYKLSDIREYDVYINDIPLMFHGSFAPNFNEKKINIDRIVQRLNEKPTFYRFHGDVVAPSFFEDRYTQQLIVDRL
jgi:deoxyribonuclease (pyrimidine dimer)